MSPKVKRIRLRPNPALEDMLVHWALSEEPNIGWVPTLRSTDPGWKRFDTGNEFSWMSSQPPPRNLPKSPTSFVKMLKSLDPTTKSKSEEEPNT
jgi:hypothetical protein